MTHVCARKPGHHWFRLWLIASSAPSHYLNQWWLVNWTIVNKFQWNGNQNIAIFVQENAFEYIGDWNQNTTVFIQENTFDYVCCKTLQWRHNERDGVSNHQRLDCLLNRLFRPRSKKTSKLRSLAFVRGIHRWPMGSPHKGPVTRKMFPFYDVIMGGHFVPTSMC